MRIVIASRLANVAGGVEEYVQQIGGSLSVAGHDLAFSFEHRSSDAAPLDLPSPAPKWAANEIGVDGVLREIRSWRPDVIYCNGLDSPAFEGALARLAPSAYSVHGYFGTCISGYKMHSIPRRVPCERRFGAACLAVFLPLRCGGLNPVTMVKRYRLESERLAAIRSYDLVIAHSRHMREEYENHGIEARLVPLPLPVSRGHAAIPDEGPGPFQLLFLGRMNELKGGDLLIAAAETVARSQQRAIELVMAGDGPARGEWQRQAVEAARRVPRLTVRFEGRVGASKREELFAQTHLLVVPSCWPEPFGMVGLEAAAFGVPAVAFDVGGIRDWLEDGVNGYLVPKLDVESLAASIARCVEPKTHATLAAGARDVFTKRNAASSPDLLARVLHQIVGSRT